MNDARQRLEALLARAPNEPTIAARLGWLEAVAEAVGGAQLGPRGDEAARDFRAALGAIIAYAQGKQDPNELGALEATVRTFVARAQHASYAGLASAYEALAKSARGLDRADFKAIARSFAEASDAIERGATVPGEAIERLEQIRRRRAGA